MARDLLRLAAEVRHELPSEAIDDNLPTIESRLLTDMIPEIAARLEGHADQACVLDGFETRLATIRLLRMAPLHVDAPMWSYLTGCVRAGNPILVALDRICPPLSTMDWASAMVHTAWTEIGQQGRLLWGPELIDADAA